jgi:hypothetical protein
LQHRTSHASARHDKVAGKAGRIRSARIKGNEAHHTTQLWGLARRRQTGFKMGRFHVFVCR